MAKDALGHGSAGHGLNKAFKKVYGKGKIAFNVNPKTGATPAQKAYAASAMGKYWAGSASQSVMNDYASGNVKTVRAGGGWGDAPGGDRAAAADLHSGTQKSEMAPVHDAWSATPGGDRAAPGPTPDYDAWSKAPGGDR